MWRGSRLPRMLALVTGLLLAGLPPACADDQIPRSIERGVVTSPRQPAAVIRIGRDFAYGPARASFLAGRNLARRKVPSNKGVRDETQRGRTDYCWCGVRVPRWCVDDRCGGDARCGSQSVQGRTTGGHADRRSNGTSGHAGSTCSRGMGLSGARPRNGGVPQGCSSQVRANAQSGAIASLHRLRDAGAGWSRTAIASTSIGRRRPHRRRHASPIRSCACRRSWPCDLSRLV